MESTRTLRHANESTDTLHPITWHARVKKSVLGRTANNFLSQEHDADLTFTKVFRNALVDSLAVLGLKGPLREGFLRDP